MMLSHAIAIKTAREALCTEILIASQSDNGEFKKIEYGVTSEKYIVKYKSGYKVDWDVFLFIKDDVENAIEKYNSL